MPRPSAPSHTHPLPLPVELHFSRKDKDGLERLALVAYDRSDPARNDDGTLKCPCIWFDGKGHAHNSYLNFNTGRSHGFIGKIHMSAGKAIDMVYPVAAMWSVYSILAFQISKVDKIDPDPKTTLLLPSTPDSLFLLFTSHLLSTLLFPLPRSIFTYHPDAAALAKLDSVSSADFTKVVYLEFHKLVDEKPGDLFSVRDPEVVGRAAWDGGVDKEKEMVRELRDLKRLIRGLV
ncbi:hypothetical protein CJF30_00006979 [Rutstroemia sp. NJR-2017a BBW]|nr:hypothetical protein CJF30_00006979 [Rutstroemia sp. NJR-2017a BBW]